jgi:hypothetical protein
MKIYKVETECMEPGYLLRAKRMIIMAFFGLATNPETAIRQAKRAAKRQEYKLRRIIGVYEIGERDF